MSGETMNSNGGNVLLAFLTGAAAGAVIALLTAPQSGRETRERLRDATRAAGDKFTKVPGAVREAYEKGSDMAKESFSQAMK